MGMGMSMGMGMGMGMADRRHARRPEGTRYWTRPGELSCPPPGRECSSAASRDSARKLVGLEQ